MSSSRRTPSTTSSSSVYDRLYSKSTESSRRLRKSAGKEDENTNGVSISKKNISSSSSKKNLPKSRHKTVMKSSQKNIRSTRTGIRDTSAAASSEVYSRLYSKGTASYNSKRKTVSTTDTIVTKKTPLKSTTNTKRTKATETWLSSSWLYKWLEANLWFKKTSRIL